MKRKINLADLIKNASDDTLAANGWSRRIAPVAVKPARPTRSSQCVVDGTRTVITLAGETPMSWNTLYSGQHWSKRSAEKNRVLSLMQMSAPGVTPYTSPVSITFTAYFSGRRFDPDNLCDKFYIDALKGWLLTNDSAVQVDSVTCRCRRDKINPRLEIEVKPL